MSMFYVCVSSMGDFLVPAMLCYGPTDPLQMNPLLVIMDYTIQSRERGNAASPTSPCWTSGSPLAQKSMAERVDFFLFRRCTKWHWGRHQTPPLSTANSATQMQPYWVLADIRRMMILLCYDLHLLRQQRLVTYATMQIGGNPWGKYNNNIHKPH